ncbi:hypothetical protein [Kitasatospora cathayae]|uniref:Uncharacterized protein n=1 Tax=Kitasatospora cathayae TaxID=3004092 RepID=A0ABY7PW70_9ACTN|nr:hypothetical protein [Kitasatospora sp. HUAS 3-15]WBP84575.1 hypothetical protein O1G21_01005 [Kitasatospora sp. HUAS 3-15]
MALANRQQAVADLARDAWGGGWWVVRGDDADGDGWREYDDAVPVIATTLKLLVEQAGDRLVDEIEVRHRAHLEPQLGWSRRASSITMGERSTPGVETQLVQVGGDVSRAAAHVRHRPATGGEDQVGEQRRSRSKVRCPGQSLAHVVGSADRDGVVRGPGVRRPAVGVHARRCSPVVKFRAQPSAASPTD